jgi:hypothetical protein
MRAQLGRHDFVQGNVPSVYTGEKGLYPAQCLKPTGEFSAKGA